MTGALKRLEDVQKDMRELRRDLDTPKRYFDAKEVSRQVRKRVAESVGESSNTHASTEQDS
jgi:hypothetical protein